MSFGQLAAGALAAITLASSLPAVAAPIYDPGAHYIFKFEGFGQAPDTVPDINRVTGQITVSAEAYQSGFSARQYANAAEFVRPAIVDRPYGLVSADISIRGDSNPTTFKFDLLSAQRVLEQKNSMPIGASRDSIVDLFAGGFVGANGGAGSFFFDLFYATDYLVISEYYDLKLSLSGDSTGGIVTANYGTDGGNAFGCNGSRCDFIANYTVSVPEPASLALLGTGVAGMIAMHRRRKAA